MRRRRFLCLAAAASPGRAPAAGSFVDETWTDAGRAGRILPMRLRWPAGDGPCAAVIHSHGLGGSRAGGSAWGEAWQAAGFAVIHLQHPGSDIDTLHERGPAGLRQAANAQAYLQRVHDAHFVLDELLRRRTGGGAWARVRADAIGFSGHSFGARLTQVLAGERPPHAPSRLLERLGEPRLRAFVAFSPGFSERDGLDDGTLRARFGGIGRPFLCVTGTQDDAVLAGSATQATRVAVYRGLPPGRRAQLVLDGADHATFGGGTGMGERAGGSRRLRREPGAAELEPRHQRLVAAITTDWWRWTLLDDRAARERLDRPAGLAPADEWEIG